MATYLKNADENAPIDRSSYKNEAGYANALSKFHGIGNLPQWQQESAARDLCEKYAITGVTFKLPTRSVNGRVVCNPDAGFTLSPYWAPGNWYLYEKYR